MHLEWQIIHVSPQNALRGQAKFISSKSWEQIIDPANQPWLASESVKSTGA